MKQYITLSDGNTMIVTGMSIKIDALMIRLTNNDGASISFFQNYGAKTHYKVETYGMDSHEA